MDNLKNILVGVDFSACSAAALKQAAHLARATRATVSALYVLPMPVYPVPDSMLTAFDFPPVDDLLANARDLWSKWPVARELGGSIQFTAEVGSPRANLLDRASSYDLLVVGAHSERDAKRRLGSTASSCVQRAQTKVLVVRTDRFEPFRSVLACIDFTETSKLALDQAIRIAGSEQASLKIVHVYEDPWAGFGPPTSISRNMPDIAERYQRAVLERLHSFCSSHQHETRALKASFHAIQMNNHGRGIVEFAESNQCDLVVLGTKAKWNIRDFVWGSTAERVVREAPCSVLAVKLLNSTLS